MELNTVLEIAASIIISLGGSGAIIMGLSKFFGQSWADKMLEKEKAKYAKEIEEYKSKLQIEIGKLGAIQDKALYISKVQYDNENKLGRATFACQLANKEYESQEAKFVV